MARWLFDISTLSIIMPINSSLKEMMETLSSYMLISFVKGNLSNGMSLVFRWYFLSVL